MMRRVGLALCFVVAAVGAGASQQAAVIDGPPPLTLSLQPGTQGMVTINAPFTQLTLGDVAIADALPKSETVIVVQAKKPGFTDLLIMRHDRLVQRVNIVVGAGANANRIYAHSPGKDVHEYTAYDCNPVCVRVFDPLARRSGQAPAGEPGVGTVLGGQGQGGSITVVLPPPPPSQ